MIAIRYLLAGYDISKPVATIEVETSNGIINVDVIEKKMFTAFGLTKKNFPIQIYDFLAHGIISEYEGVLGLDFLDELHFCLDLKKNLISTENFGEVF